MLYCKKCGAPVEEHFRFCEKCFSNLSVEGAVVNNCGLASAAAGKAIESGDFSADAFVINYDFSGCRVGKYRLSEKVDACFNSDYYQAVDVENGEKYLVRHLYISEKNASDRFSLISGHSDGDMVIKSSEICSKALLRHIDDCRTSNVKCGSVSVDSFFSSDKTEAHIFIAFTDSVPLAVRLKKEPMSIRDILRISIDVCRILGEFERNRISYNSIFETNIFIDANGEVFLGAEYDVSLQKCFIETETSLGYTAYIPPDNRVDDSISVYSLAVMLYRMLNSGRLPYMNSYSGSLTYSDRINAERYRNSYLELQLPAKAENMLGNVLVGIISNSDWRSVGITSFKQTLENALNYLSSQELDRYVMQ